MSTALDLDDAVPAARAATTRAVPTGRVATAAAVALLMLGTALAVRWLSFLPAVIDTDEGLYMLQAREWLRGNWPLVAVWDMHPVGVPALFALGMAVLGESIGAVRLLGSIAAAATGCALYGAARSAGVGRPTALAAGVLYIGQTVLFGGLATNTEILFAPFVTAVVAIGIRAAARALDFREAPRWGALVAMGMLIGIALTMKPVVVPQGSLAFALFALPAWWRGALPLRRGLAMAAAYAALAAAPTALFGLAYAMRGEFAAFLDGSFLAPVRYAGGGLTPADAAWEIATMAVYVAWPFALALLALSMPNDGSPDRRLATIGGLWIAAATVAVAIPGMFYNHYFLIWLPSLSLLAALGTARLVRLVGPRRPGAVFAGLVGALVANAWLVDAAPRLDRAIGLMRPDPVRQTAAALAALVPPGAPVLIVNYHTVVQVLAGTNPPSRYAFPAHLTGRFRAVTGIDIDAELARVLAARPAAIVVDRGWPHTIDPAAAAMVFRTLDEAYVLAATVQEERGPVEIWRPR